MALTNLNKLFVRVTDAGLRNAVITKSETDNKIYFLTTTHEIITHGVAYGLSTDVQAQIANIKSILKSFDNNGHGTEDSVNAAIGAVQTALNDYKTANDANRALLVKTVAYNAVNKTIDFTSENGTTVQSIKASDIIGNHLVESSSYNAITNHLTLTFKGAEAPVDVDIDLSQLLDMNDVVSSNETYFTVNYVEKKLTITPVTKKVTSGEEGIADAKDVKSYVDAAVSGAQDTLQDAIDTINGRLNTIQGEETVEGSINKALKDAKDHTNTEVGKTNNNLTVEITERKAADQALYGGEIPADGAHTISGNAAAIKDITDALANPATFWEDYTA